MAEINEFDLNAGKHITKISEVTPEVTLFLRNLGFTNYYIVKIFDLVGEASIALVEENPYWLLEEFPRMGFTKVDEVAKKLGIDMNSSNRLEAAVEFVMKGYMAEGHSFAPVKELCQRVGSVLDMGSEFVEDVLRDMVFEGKLYFSEFEDMQIVYFYSYYKAECRIAGKLADLESPKGGLKPVGGNVETLIRKSEISANIKLSIKQKQAVENALLSGVSIITGGPGTGKTTIIRSLLSIMEGSGLKVLVAAPTGRAAKRAMEATDHFACTIHRLLDAFYDENGIVSFGRNREKPLECDCVIIDEASMMDLILMEALCNAIKTGTRLILVGDADQLPSVGVGNVLGDLIDSEYFFTSKLNEIYRQGKESNIVINAHNINKGMYPEYGEDFLLITGNKQQDIANKIVETAKKFPLDQVQILTPVKKGILGSFELNIKLQEAFNPVSEDKDQISFGKRTFRVGDRVMQTKNNYRIEYLLEGESKITDGKGVFNGEIGIVAAVDKDMKTVTVVYDEERWVEYPYILLEEIELAYAVTVHKSQGSEFPVVIIPMSWFPPALATRSLIYTAITRGKKAVYIVGNPSYMNAMIDNNQSRSRYSGLKNRLIGMYQTL